MFRLLVGGVVLLGLSVTAQAFAIATLNVSVSAAPFGDDCTQSLTGLGGVSCSSIGTGAHAVQDYASANANAQDYSIALMVTQGTVLPLIASGSVDLERDDFYNIAVNGPVFAYIAVSGNFGAGGNGQENPPSCIFSGVTGACGNSSMLNAGFTVLVPLTALSNVVELRSSLQATEPSAAVNSGGVLIRMNVLGFQDAIGNAVAASLIPEPRLTGVIGLILAAMLRRRAPL